MPDWLINLSTSHSKLYRIICFCWDVLLVIFFSVADFITLTLTIGCFVSNSAGAWLGFLGLAVFLIAMAFTSFAYEEWML